MLKLAIIDALSNYAYTLTNTSMLGEWHVVSTSGEELKRVRELIKEIENEPDGCKE